MKFILSNGKKNTSNPVYRDEIRYLGDLVKEEYITSIEWYPYAAAQVKTMRTIRQIFCEQCDSSSLIFIFHPQQWCTTRAKPKAINHRTAKTNPAAPVKPTDWTQQLINCTLVTVFSIKAKITNRLSTRMSKLHFNHHFYHKSKNIRTVVICDI